MEILDLKSKVLQQIENADEQLLTRLSNFIDVSIENNLVKELLELSEKEYVDGKTENYSEILKVSKEKYFTK